MSGSRIGNAGGMTAGDVSRRQALAGGVAGLLALAAAPRAAGAAAEVWPGAAWAQASPGQVGMDAGLLNQAVAYGRNRGGSGFVARNGYRVAGWGSASERYGLLSTTKSFGSILLGLAVDAGRLDVDDRAVDRMDGFGRPPASNGDTGWLPQIRLDHLATHTAGFQKDGGFTALAFRPGTAWSYSDGGANWLADVVTTAFDQDLAAVLRSKVLGPLQVSNSALTWRANAYRPKTLGGVARREFGSGIYASVDAMARVGLMMARGGAWDGRRILSAGYVDKARTTPSAIKPLAVRGPGFTGATKHYGLLWWNNNDGTMPDVPRDAFWSWGKGESFILVVPSLDLVAARAGPAWRRDFTGDYDVVEPFFAPLARSAA